MVGRGTTAHFKFRFQISTSLFKQLKITIRQGQTVLYKYIEDVEFLDEYSVQLRLNQKETFMFEPDSAISIQPRYLTLNGDCPPTPIFRVNITECLDEEVLV